MRCKEDVHKDFASTVMRSSLLGIDTKALNFFYWKEILMLKPKKTIARSTRPNLPSDLDISLHTLTGWTVAKTMNVTAQIENYEVVVLIVSSSTHNFISDKVAVLL